MSVTSAAPPPAGGPPAGPADLISAHYQRLVAWFVYRVRLHQTAEDLAHDTLTLAWRNMGSYDPARPFWPWLVTIACRQLATAARSGRLDYPVRWDEQQEPDDTTAGAVPQLQDLIRQEDRTRVRAAIGGLPPRHREAVLLYYFDELQVDQISRALGTPPGTVYRWLSEARRQLEAALTDLNPACR